MERPRLISLATELLTEILRHVLVLEGTEFPIPKDSKSFLSVLGSCRKLREIGTDVLLKENTYHFTATHPRYSHIRQTGGPIHLDRFTTPSFSARNVVRSICLVVDKTSIKSYAAEVSDKNGCLKWLLPLKHLAWHGFWGTESVKMEIRGDRDYQPPRILGPEPDDFLEKIVYTFNHELLELEPSTRSMKLNNIRHSVRDIWVRTQRFEFVEGIDQEFARTIQDGVHLCMCNGPEDSQRHAEHGQVISTDWSDLLCMTSW